MPVLAVDAGSGPFTSGTMAQVAETVSVVTLDGVGHLVAMEALAVMFAPWAAMGEPSGFRWDYWRRRS